MVLRTCNCIRWLRERKLPAQNPKPRVSWSRAAADMRMRRGRKWPGMLVISWYKCGGWNFWWPQLILECTCSHTFAWKASLRHDMWFSTTKIACIGGYQELPLMSAADMRRCSVQVWRPLQHSSRITATSCSCKITQKTSAGKTNGTGSRPASF